MAKAPALFMETTKIKDVDTVAEIQHLLATRGAKRVSIEYDGGRVAAVDFQYTVNGVDVPFRLPCRWQAIKERLSRNRQRYRRNGDTIDDKARRVAWRQVLRWIEAQLALIDTGMAKTQEVFLPYAIMHANGKTKTMFEYVEENKFMALPAHEGDK